MKVVTVKGVFFFLAGLLLLGGLNGCGTIIFGTHQNISITSKPDNVNFKIEDLTLNGSVPFSEGKTPSTVSLHRKHSYLVTLSQPGYEPKEIPIEYGRYNPWVFWLGSPIIDGNTGAAFILEPDEVNVNLMQLSAKGTVTNFSPNLTDASKDNDAKATFSHIDLEKMVPQDPELIFHSTGKTCSIGKFEGRKGSSNAPILQYKVTAPELNKIVFDSLKYSQLFTSVYSSEQKNADYTLTARILGQPFSHGMTYDSVTLYVNYCVRRNDTGEIVFNKRIESPYTEKDCGLVRISCANEGAVRENIKKFLEELSKVQL